MHWILENARLFFGLAAIIAYAVTQARNASKARAGAPRPDVASPDADERARRVQEEIRRKIAERRGATGPSASVRTSGSERTAAKPAAGRVRPLDPFGGPLRPPVILQRPAAPAFAREAESDSAERAIMERQEKLAAQLRELDVKRQAELARAQQMAASRAARARTETPRTAGTDTDLALRLRDPSELRRAIVLRELLGPPVALR